MNRTVVAFRASLLVITPANRIRTRQRKGTAADRPCTWSVRTLLLLAIVLTACTPSARGAPAGTTGAERATPCPLTTPPPVAYTPPPPTATGPNAGLNFRAGPDSFLYVNEALVVALPKDGTLHPDPANGKPEIEVKFGWWRSIPGELAIETRRLDASTPPLAASIPAGYGDRGFQVSGLRFPSAGCWQVTGTVGGRSLAFVVTVARR